MIRQSAVVVMLALASALAQNAPTSKPPDPVPIPTMAPEELPARAPRVSYHDGHLIIDADNATLAEVLNAVSQQTGAKIETPTNADSERVVAHLSGPPRQVLADLLDGGKFGYIILSSLQDPARIETVIITRETESKPGSQAMSEPATRRPPGAAPAQSGPTTELTAETTGAATTGAAAPRLRLSVSDLQIEAEKERVAGEPGSPDMPGSSDGTARGDALQSSDNANAGQPQDKSPMQTLQDLYRKRQQLQLQTQPQPKPQDH